MANPDFYDILQNEYLLKHRWNERNPAVCRYIPAGSSILDLGCGDKDILNFIECDDYWGVDLCPLADQVHDFDHELLEFGRTWDVGLLLGVITYPKDVDKFLNHYKKFAKRWIIVINPKEYYLKSEWNNYFNNESLVKLLQSHFGYVSLPMNIATTIPTLYTGDYKNFTMCICSNSPIQI